MKHTGLYVALLCAVVLTACSGTPKSGSFTIGDKKFVLNGDSFTIKAAEIHYPRIPQAYWEHRIKMCKSLGMNTICLYVFWNIHEPAPGTFDFGGQNDVAAFCRLAQKHGMYVILRPGPYVCAEWEMGGLPWWLLKKEGIQLRTLDPYYMERVEIFMQEVGRQLADLQITRGGNILMVQVENEYGSYGVDKPYVAAVRDIVRKSGFNEVPLFQCDWSSNFQNNALDDMLWTINFGTGSNIDQQFRSLKALRPHTPLMCSEFWSGWFDRWGSPHETRSKEALISGLKDMLDRNISFSLYMTHGGTTFGHWAGANCPPYASWCSSYDYDAPISEAGHATEKFEALRALLAQYTGGKKLPAVPKAYPVIAVDEFSMSEQYALFEHLPKAHFCEQPKSMEFFDQGYGSIMYRTTLPAGGAGRILKITEVHDWAAVYVNGVRIGTLDRRHAEKTLSLPATEKDAVLTIFVENMGRVNYAKTIHDYKGITESVELIEKNKSLLLSGFEVYNFPADVTSVQETAFSPKTSPENQPAFYRGRFTLEKMGDTYLDMSAWGKGLVWVNGHAIGRFWQIGPQQTLYVPGCWLNKGENEVLVLDILGPNTLNLQGLSYPILDSLKLEKEQVQAGETGQWNRVD